MPEKDPHTSLWMLIALAFLCGLAGELYRAEKDGVSGKKLFQRVTIRFLASGVIGVLMIMLCFSAEFDVWLTGFLVGSSAMLGADIMLSIYERIIAAKTGANSGTH